MIHILAFSGGKDSTALIPWAAQNLEVFRVVFCDTGWEHEITYQYIEMINQRFLRGRLIVLRSGKYDGMMDLVTQRKRIPSVRARFCTEELKYSGWAA